MKAKGALLLLSVVVLLSWGFTQEIKPVAVSPGSERGVARVSEHCPTFSWSAVGWAAGYRVVVFEAKAAEIRTYERMALAAVPVLTQDIPGKALSWTPSEGQGLRDGGLYVWYVQARDASGNGLWSVGKAFIVEVEKTPIPGVEERATRRMRERGVSADVITEMSREPRGGAPSGAIAKGFTLKSSGQTSAGGGLGAVRTQGYEGDATHYNVYYGYGAGASLTSGQWNSFFGHQAGNKTTSGVDNTFIGYYAGYGNATGYDNVFLGSNAGVSNYDGYENTFVGYSAGKSSIGNHNTFLGFYAGFGNYQGHYNTFVGTSAGQQNYNGLGNTMVGYRAGIYNHAHYGTFLGNCAGFSNTDGNHNVFLGASAGYSNTSGYHNTFLGTDAGNANTAGFYNTFLGHSAGYSNTASCGTLLGYKAGYSNTTGINNTSVGYSAGHGNQTGSYNTMIGYQAGYSNTASSNTFLGYYSGYANTTGTYNTFFGQNAGRYSTTGSNNVYLGLNSAYNNMTGGNNVAMGVNAGFNNAGSGNVFLGYRTGFYETGSNKLYIDNYSDTFPLIYGDFGTAKVGINGYLGVGVQNPSYRIQVTGGAYCNGTTWTNASSRALKENIQGLRAEDAQAALEDLTPVRFNYKTDATEECLGFIAEDVPSLVATGDRKGLSPMDIVAVLTKVAQEQRRTIDGQQKALDEQRQMIDELRSEIEALKHKN